QEEGFIYALGIEQHLLSTPLVSEFLESLRNWGRDRGYALIRVEVPEGEPFQPVTGYLQSLGWMTSCLIPYKKLSSPLETSVQEILLQRDGDLSIRAAVEDDYPFVFELLTEAAWLGMSSFEHSGVDRQALLANIRRDFEPLLKEGVAWSFVAETSANQLCAHCTVLEGTHTFLDVREAELVDTFILPAYSGRHLSSKLTAHALAACLSKGIPLVYGSLIVEATPEEEVLRVRSALEQTGWWMSSRILYRDIPS